MKTRSVASRALGRLRERLFPVLHYPCPEAAEWLSVRGGLWWCWLLTPALHLFATNTLFAGFRRLAPEGDWQAGMGAIIGAQLLAFFLGGRGQRAAVLALAACVWAFIAGVTCAAAPHFALRAGLGPAHWRATLSLATGIGIYASLAADCAVAAVFLCKQLYADWLTRQGIASKAEGAPPAPGAGPDAGAGGEG